MTSRAHPQVEATRIDQAALEELRRAFRGELVTPDHPSYDEHRAVWNGSIDRHPALIARCTGVADVIAAVNLARQTGDPRRGPRWRPQLPGPIGV